MISIEKPTIEDAGGVQRVFYSTWLDTYPNKEAGITVEDIKERFGRLLSKEAIERRKKTILNTSENILFLVAKDGEDIIGVCNAIKTKEFNQLQAIYVLPSHQRDGIGTMFWDKVMEYFGNKKDIIVQVATYNQKAIGFYKKLGFVDTGKRFNNERFKMPISGSYIHEMELVIKNHNSRPSSNN